MYRDYFVTADWLHTHLNDDNLVVLDVSKAPLVGCQQIAISYVFERHIPAQHHFDLDKVADPPRCFADMLLSPEVIHRLPVNRDR